MNLKKKRKLDNDENTIATVHTSQKRVIHPFPSKFEYIHKKRTPKHPPVKEWEILVSRKSKPNSLLKRGRKLLKEKHQVILHGLGAAIQNTVELALMLREEYSLFKDRKIITSIETTTVTLVDDFYPKSGNGKMFSQIRRNSAIHIKLELKLDKKIIIADEDVKMKEKREIKVKRDGMKMFRRNKKKKNFSHSHKEKKKKKKKNFKPKKKKKKKKVT